MTCPIKNPTCHRETEAKCPTRTPEGMAVCWLGNDPVVYNLKPRIDGKIDLTLSLTHRQFLTYIAERGGEVPYDYNLVKPDTADHIKKLVEMRLISEIAVVGSTKRVIFRLTDMGRNVVTQILKARSVI